MQVVYKKLNELKHYENNNKIHDEENIKQIAKSIDEFGFTMPILIDENNVIICGHARILGAKQLGYKEVPCIMLDKLDDEQIKAYRVADNKLAELSEWNFDSLEKELKELQDSNFDLDILGFDKGEIERLLGGDNLLDDLGDGNFANEINDKLDTFNITFSFQKQYSDIINDYIDEKGKEYITNKIIELCGGIM